MHVGRPAPTRAAITVITVVQLFALAIWAGGLLALGAIVAPIVFRVVPAPTSADAMTLVFGRFDSVAISCAAVALLAEVAFAMRGGKVRRADLVRGLALVCATGLAITIGAWLSPGISELHRAGAMRGVGDLGLALDRLHHLAELLAKTEIALVLVAFVLAILKATRPLC